MVTEVGVCISDISIYAQELQKTGVLTVKARELKTVHVVSNSATG